MRRHGFHGLSVEWATERGAALLGRPATDLRLVVCHLGGGASATAVEHGVSRDTSMGFSPLEGLVMATRSGSLDPDIPLHLIVHDHMAPEEVQRMLNEESGLTALAGTPDMREVEARAAAGDASARLALAVHDHRLAATVAAMAASLGGLDAVVFTGGVGEGSARVRAEAARRLAFLGLAVDPVQQRGAGRQRRRVRRRRAGADPGGAVARGGRHRARRAPGDRGRGMTAPRATTLSDLDLRRLDAHWRAANYLSVGQIYLLDNPLLREPLRIEHVKPRLLGHWGTSPGLNFIYAHMNRAILARDLEALFVTGPGHGGPAIVANTYLEGTYSEVYPEVSRDVAGMRRLFRQFSFPGGIPSHVAPETPGSIHEGGELGYSLAHAYGAAFDNPGLVVCCVVGDGEAETGPLAGSWHSNKFLDPVGDGAVLPILHLNGYKIANPTILARIPAEELTALFRGYGHRPLFVEGSRPGR